MSYNTMLHPLYRKLNAFQDQIISNGIVIFDVVEFLGKL